MKLIAHWQHMWFRRVSTWLAALNAIFVGYVFSQPVLVIGMIGFAPDGWILPLAAGASLLAFVLPVVVTHVAQPRMQAKVKAKVKAKTEDSTDADQSE